MEKIQKLKEDSFYISYGEKIPIKEGYITNYKGKRFIGFRKITKKEKFVDWLCTIPIIKNFFNVTEW